MATRKPKRRGNGEGSIFQQTTGRWCGQVQLGHAEDGKPIRKAFYGKTRQEVAEKVNTAVGKVFTGAPSAVAARLTVKELLDEYLWSFKKPSVADVTFAWYLNVANHVYREFAGVRITSVTTTQVQRVLNKIYETGLSRKSIKDIRLLLNQLFKFAVEQDFVTKNPVASTKLPKESRVLTDHDDEVKAISPDDRATILAATEGNPVMKTALTTLMFTGMRIGEFLALTWENVDFEKGVISVNAALTHATEYDDRKLTRRSTVVGTTKTSSGVRNIKVSSVVTDALREWREYLPSHFRCAVEHDPLAPTAVVFPNDRGEMRTYNGFRTTYRRFMTEKQLPPYTLHSYRHTFATMLLEQGVNPRVVQKLLGHADIETTLGTYSHVFSEVYDGAADKLTAVFDGMMGA